MAKESEEKTWEENFQRLLDESNRILAEKKAGEKEKTRLHKRAEDTLTRWLLNRGIGSRKCGGEKGEID